MALPEEPLRPHGEESDHFTYEELKCHHCGVNGCRPQLLRALEQFRVIVRLQPGFERAAVEVLSAYRCAKYNSITPNAAKNSQHPDGDAADIWVKGMSAAQLEAIALQVPDFAAGGIGRNDHADYIHVDTRGSKARWCYSSDPLTLGKSIAYFSPRPAETKPA